MGVTSPVKSRQSLLPWDRGPTVVVISACLLWIAGFIFGPSPFPADDRTEDRVIVPDYLGNHSPSRKLYPDSDLQHKALMATSMKHDATIRALSKACLDKQSMQAEAPSEHSAAGPMPTISHIINPFQTDDVHFNFTLRSIATAVDFAKKQGILVEVLGVSFVSESIDLPPQITPLNIIADDRTAGTVLQHLGIPLGDGEKPLRTPVVGDVFLAAHRHARAPTIVWTNFDLIVKPSFYVDIATNLKKKVGFSILRLDLLIEKSTHPSLSQWSVNDIYDYGETRGQAGHDCFVFPTRWIPCLDFRNFVFGVAGWGYCTTGSVRVMITLLDSKQSGKHPARRWYALFAELILLSKLEVTDASRGFSVLKPGVHFRCWDGVMSSLEVKSGSGITRHIGSQVANPKRFYSNPVPWLGPLRRNQLAFNMREKLALELDIVIARDPDMVCRRTFLSQGDSKCITETSDRNDYVGDARPSSGTRCPQKPGAQQPVAVAVPSLAVQASVARIIGSMTHMATASVHSPSIKTEEFGQFIAMFTRATNMHASLVDLADNESVEKATHPITPKPRWPPAAWDTVIVVLDNNPVATIAGRFLHAHGHKSADSVATENADSPETRALLQPLVDAYVRFYTHWAEQTDLGLVYIRVLDVHGGGNASLAAQELHVLAEILHKVKLGQGNRWCRGAPMFDVCCGLADARDSLRHEAMALRVLSPDLKSWVQRQVADVTARMHTLWQRQRDSTTIPNAGACCPSIDATSDATPTGTVPLSSTTPPNTEASAGDVPTEVWGTRAEPRSRAIDVGERPGRADRVRTALPGLFARVDQLHQRGSGAQQTSMPMELRAFKSPCWKNHSTIQCLPYFFLLGQTKCGTTDFYTRLRRHPLIHQTLKEQHWFSREWYNGDHYLKQYAFPQGNADAITDMITGDGTPDYIWSHLRCLNREFKYPVTAPGARVTVAEALAELTPNARLILLLREPVQRLWSDFFYFAHRRERDLALPNEKDVNATHFHTYVQHGVDKVNACLATSTMDECVWTARTLVFGGPTRLVMGCYAPFIKEYLRNFNKSQLLIHSLEDYHSSPQQVLHQTFQHLNIRIPEANEWPRILRSDRVGGAINTQQGRYQALSMLPQTRTLLQAFYGSCNTALAALLNDTRYLAWNAAPSG